MTRAVFDPTLASFAKRFPGTDRGFVVHLQTGRVVEKARLCVRASRENCEPQWLAIMPLGKIKKKKKSKKCFG